MKEKSKELGNQLAKEEDKGKHITLRLRDVEKRNRELILQLQSEQNLRNMADDAAARARGKLKTSKAAVRIINKLAPHILTIAEIQRKGHVWLC